MSYRSLSVVVFTLFAIACNSAKHSGNSKDIMPGTWQVQPVVIDGDSKEWPSPYPNYDAKAMVAYATSNDKENLYITMETGDELTQMKILKQGMTVMIDTTGNKDPQLSVSYPLPNDNDPLDMTADEGGLKKDTRLPGGSRRWDKKIGKAIDQANQYAIEGFSNCSGGYAISQTAPCGIKIKMRLDEYKELVWEAMIPFKAIYNRDVITAADAGKPISVCFAVKGFKSPGAKNQDNNSAGMNNNMGTGAIGMNSRMHNGTGGGGRTAESPMQHLYESTKTWKFFGLAYQ